MADEAPREAMRIRSPLVAAVMASYLLFVGLSAAGLYTFYRSLAPSSTYISPRAFPAPRLVTIFDGARDPGVARQQAALDRYRWIDRGRGLVQIPVTRAMTIVAARGADAYAPLPTQGTPGK